MPISKEAFVDNYLNEAKENLVLLSDVVIALRRDPDNPETLAELLRLLHTLKGSSRMMNYPVLEEIAHSLEDIFKGVKDRRFAISKPLIQLVLSSVDYMELALKAIRNTGSDDIPHKRLKQAFQKAMSGLQFNLDDLEEDRDRGSVQEVSEVAEEKKSGLGDYDTVRIKVSVIDDIVKQLNGLIIQQFKFKKENETLAELETGLREIQDKFRLISDRIPEAGEYTRSVDNTVKLVQKIRKSYSEETAQLEHMSFELQEDILGLRMLPMEIVLGPLKKMVEETALMLDKEIDFSISGTDLLLDKTILEQINDPIIHLLRNAIDHGIEPVEERIAGGKDKAGNISISCHSEGGRINISIRDDGRGIDYEGIRKKALELNPDQEEEIREMEERNLVNFLFQSGFTTTRKVTSLSGRGVGLDIVRSNIENIKGKITLESTRGEGTEFLLSLPLSLATVAGFFVSSRNERFLIPAAFVREILIVQRSDVIQVLNRNVIRLRDMIIPVYPLSSLLEGEESYSGDKLSVVIVESLGDIIGIVVDSVIQFTSLIYKPLPGNLVNLKAIQGVVFDENFDIINILFIPELIDRFKGIRNIEFRRKFSSRSKEYKQILVVDDSKTTREIEKSILELDHYNVDLAEDGIDALDKLKKQYYHLIITDVKMPRMDGITLIENLRRQDKYKSTPVIVVSSEDMAGLKDSAMKAGANAIINKKDFDRGSLLEKVRNLLGKVNDA
ncbi:hybrid sensor histidine kinase/response regulator [Spirochaeta isovalerica]|uniref:histidine kinase n=1 Tax=Spirochaeta isovalerica TaxID=150 RepID=A0A841RD02_9SPIO|nr:response regulator [Spirochaeta isovalerica]MBB6481833.1 two-component system chemotaxis sensor kinase CheA [Spirochaeta isovalerica]